MKQESQNPESPVVASNARWYARPTENKNHKKNKTGPCKRWGHSTAIADSRLFIYGGTGYTTNSRYWESIYQLDLENWDWTKIEPLNKSPSSRDSHSCIVHNNKLYIFGGSTGTDSINDMYEYDLTLNMWKKLDVKGNVPSPREGHAACLLDGRYMVIYGGWNGEETFDNCYLFDIPQRTWLFVERMLGIKPPPMESQSCCMVRRDMYFFGGQGNSIQKLGESFDNFFNDLHRLRIRFDDDNTRTQASATWELIEPKGIKPSKRSSHSSCAYKDRYVFIVGGEGYPSGIDEDKQPVEYRRAKNDENSEDYPCFPKSDVWAYDVELNQWSQLKIKNEVDFIPRFAHSNVIYKEMLVVFGGLHDYHHSTNDIHVLCLDGGNPFQPKNAKFTNRLFADEGMKQEDESQSEKSSLFHYEAEPKEKEPVRAIEPVRSSSRKASVVEPPPPQQQQQQQQQPKIEPKLEPKIEPKVEKASEVPLEKMVEEMPITQKPLVSTNFVYSLSNVLSWPLAAFGLMLDNSLIVEAHNFHIKYLTKLRRRDFKDIIDGDHGISDSIGYLVIEDDGQGWDHEDFIKILSSYEMDEIEEPKIEATGKDTAQAAGEGVEEEEKIYNSEEEEEEKKKQKQKEEKKKEDLKKRKIHEFAFNFKVASVRLGKNIIFISNNGEEISLGFISADRRFNPNLHRNHVFYYSWKKGTGEYLTKRAEKNRSIISNALKGSFTIDELATGIEKIGNRVIILDLKTVMGFTLDNQTKQDLELLKVCKEGPNNVVDVMVRTLDKNLNVFYHDPSVSLVDLSLKTYLSYFFLDPNLANINVYLNGNQVDLVSVKGLAIDKAQEAAALQVSTEGSFEGVILEQLTTHRELQEEHAGKDHTANHLHGRDIIGNDELNQGVLIYYKNRLIRRLENSKMGNLDFLSSQYRNFMEGKDRNPHRLLFEKSGYIELKNELKPNAFKTEIENPFYSNFFHASVMLQMQRAQGLNGKRVADEGENEDEEIVKKVKTTPV